MCAGLHVGVRRERWNEFTVERGEEGSGFDSRPWTCRNSF